MNKNTEILIVDDYTPIRKTIVWTLESMGFQNISSCSNGKEACRILALKHIGLIISDLNMPLMNGQQLLIHTRAHENLKNIPFIMVTAEGDRRSVAAAIEAGVTGFMIKPFTPASLKEKVQQALNDRSPSIPPEQPPEQTDNPLKKSVEYIDHDKRSEETILVVDDQPSNIDVIANLLSPLYKVKATTRGKIALKIIESTSPPDLILLDIMMPEIDGYQVCKFVKSNPATANIPIMFLSTKGEVADITKGFSLGAVDYMTKPVEPEIMIARIKTHLALRASHAKLADQINTMLKMSRLKEDVERITQHDIKNPLSSISTQITNLQEDPETPENHQEKLQSIRQSANQALNIVCSSLDLYRMESGNYILQPVQIDVIDIIKQVIYDLKNYAIAHRVLLELRLFTRKYNIIGENTLCYSAFTNLIKNAIEASPEKSKVNISIESLDHQLAVRILNQGIVPLSIRDKFFDKYVTANKPNGTGLGTYSAKLMTIIQKGTVNFEVIEEKSTVLTVKLRQP